MSPASSQNCKFNVSRRSILLAGIILAASALATGALTNVAQAQQQSTVSAGQRPNIVFIMADDVGWLNVGVYNQGMMAGRTPNLDKLASEGMRFTDYYAEASCTAGRANFVTGQLPIRTGLTTVGQAGASLGMPAQSPTIATALKSQGYATGQFGKNHFGDLNQFLPTLHGFDEFWGYLYHLDAMEDPFHRNYPPDLLDKVGPRLIRAGARSANKRSLTRGRSRPILFRASSTTWRPSTRSSATSRLNSLLSLL